MTGGYRAAWLFQFFVSQCDRVFFLSLSRWTDLAARVSHLHHRRCGWAVPRCRWTGWTCSAVTKRRWLSCSHPPPLPRLASGVNVHICFVTLRLLFPRCQSESPSKRKVCEDVCVEIRIDSRKSQSVPPPPAPHLHRSVNPPVLPASTRLLPSVSPSTSLSLLLTSHSSPKIYKSVFFSLPPSSSACVPGPFSPFFAVLE